MSYKTIEQSLYKYTDSWSVPEGSYPASDKKDLEDITHILSQHYENVNKHHLDINRKTEEGTIDYMVTFDTPKLNEEDELEYMPDKNPTAGPLGGGMAEEYDDLSVLNTLLGEDLITEMPKKIGSRYLDAAYSNAIEPKRTRDGHLICPKDWEEEWY